MTMPTLDIDFYSDAVIKDPYPVYEKMRALGPVVYLPQHDLYALPRYREVSEVLRQPLRFVSSRGVSPIQKVNDILVGSTLNSDPPEHDRTRAVTSEPLLPGALKDIEPMLNMAYALDAAGASWKMHYAGRTADRLAFTQELARFGNKVQLHIDAGPAEQRLDIGAAPGAPAQDQQLYVCGPNGFMEFIVASADRAGSDDRCLHLERFGAKVNTDGAPFTVIAQKSGKRFDVQPGETIAQKLKEIGIPVQVSCQLGVCGTCLTPVLGDRADHRDLVQTDLEKATNAQITVCCSRSKTKKLILDV